MLFINQFYWPDSSATSQQLTDLTKALVARGHDVAVLCGEGGYADQPGVEAPPVKVHRVKTTKFARGTLGRMLSYLSFYVKAAIVAIKIERPEVVVSLTTPPLISLLGTSLKTLKGAKHFIWEQDVYPDVAVDLAYFKPGGLAHRLTGVLADFSRRHADGIIALGDCMKQRLVKRRIPAEKIVVAEHWADSSAILPLEKKSDADKLVVLYSGNFGMAHDAGTLMSTLLALRDDQRFKFIFSGTGKKRDELLNFCSRHQIDSVELRSFVPRDQLSEGLALGDIGLVTQEPQSCGSVVPSKVYGILASGRPILFIGPAAATPAQIIARHQCGWHFECDDSVGVTSLLKSLADRRELVDIAGKRARQALLDFYDLPQSVGRIARVLENSTDGQQGIPLTASGAHQ